MIPLHHHIIFQVLPSCVNSHTFLNKRQGLFYKHKCRQTHFSW